MKPMLKALLSTTLLACLLAFASQALAIKPGDDLPQIIGRDMAGLMFALSQHQKQPKVLNFFWVECGPCRKEIPELAKLQKQYAGIQFIVVHAEDNPKTQANYDIGDVLAFLEGLEAYPPMAILGSSKLKEDIGIKAFPMTVLVSRDNKVEKVLNGLTDETLSELEAWLKQKE